MLKAHFEQVWNQLRAKRQEYRDYLERIRLDGIRGLSDLQVAFPYPVTVLAGPNACGKSTILFASACAYKRLKDNLLSGRYPSEVFPDLLNRDMRREVQMDFYYVAGGRSVSMRWSRSKGKWSRSYFGRKKGDQPQRITYLRTVANLTSPSEIRRYLQFSRAPLEEESLPASVLAFAHRILLFHYSEVKALRRRAMGPDLLFVLQEQPESASYSEFHMSSGERAVLRIAKEVSQLRNALVLMDEIEAGLHPFTQQHLMLELQRLALRNEIQFIVATHSPAVLESVPPEARVFLERIEGKVAVRRAYRDVLRRALYGRPLDKLIILC